MSGDDLKWRQTKWNSFEGQIKICDMEDTHVVNVLHYLMNLRVHPNGLNPEARRENIKNKIKLFKKEMKYRKLDFNLLKNAPYPFIDKKGNKAILDYEKGLIKTPPSVRFITEGESEGEDHE